MKKFIKFKINLNTNFKPYYNHSYNFNKIKKKKKICKTFFFFLILLKFFNKINFFKNKLLFKKKNNINTTLLRPPYRHKLSRHQITLQRYNISYLFYIEIKINILYYNLNNFKKIINFFNLHLFWLESNIIYQNSINLNFFFLSANNFKIKNFL